MDADHESILLIKQEVFVYKIPPAGSNRKHRYSVKIVLKSNQINLSKWIGILWTNVKCFWCEIEQKSNHSLNCQQFIDCSVKFYCYVVCV